MPSDIIQSYLESYGLKATLAEPASWVILGLAITLICIIANHIAKKYILKLLGFIVKKTKTNWDDILMEKKVFNRLSHLAPALIIYFAAPLFSVLQSFVHKAAIVYILIVAILVVDSLLNGVVSIYETFTVSKEKPIKGYIQLVKIFVYVTASIFIVSAMTDSSPWGLISGLGAMTAVILLVFKDSILGFVAGIQISAYDIARKGDWVVMPGGVDGDILDISLTTVKIQNFDKTIVTVPTYSLVSNTVQNWRGMAESGGRRIKRSVNIDLNTISFCSEEQIARFKEFSVLKDYMQRKEKDITQDNQKNAVNMDQKPNGRRLTNIGCFRAYISEYLKQHPKIHQTGMTFLVRQLAPTEKGVPIQIYVFTNDTAWVNYENIQSDIFDHILAVVPEFGLRVYQNLSGSDLAMIKTVA